MHLSARKFYRLWQRRGEIRCVHDWLVIPVNAESSSKRFWRGPRAQEVGKPENYTPNATLSKCALCDQSIEAQALNDIVI